MEDLSLLLSQLAEKFGTTSEYLWEVLLRQAPIEGFIILYLTVFVIILAMIILKVHLWLSKIPEGGNYSRYDDMDGIEIPMVFLAIAIFIAFVLCICYFGEMVTAFVNPEYWALKEILDTIGN